MSEQKTKNRREQNREGPNGAHSDSIELLISCRWGFWAIAAAVRDANRAAAWWVLLNRLQTSIMTWGVQHMMMRSNGVRVQAKDLFTDAIKVM